MTSNDEFRDLPRSVKLWRVVRNVDETETSNEIYDECFGLQEDVVHTLDEAEISNEICDERFGLQDDNFRAWTDYIFNVDIYYYRGNITFEILFENDEEIVCTLDEICSQSKMRDKMEEAFRAVPPMLTPDEYELVVFTIMCIAFEE